ncbi:MAG TPA: hypothetical protein VJ086_04595, partial [Rubrobacteraceae bacterium]|nr:hypothetical protein [Rubrobacteraceae bacterium]
GDPLRAEKGEDYVQKAYVEQLALLSIERSILQGDTTRQHLLLVEYHCRKKSFATRLTGI